MRPTLHDYVIDGFNEKELFPREAYNFAKLTNRAPRLGDFVPCDDDSNVLEKPEGYINWLRAGTANFHHNEQCLEYQAAQDRVIFNGDWEVIDQDLDWVQIRSKDLKLDIEWSGNECDVTVWDSNWNTCDYLSANRIDDLPRQIEFKEGVV